MAERRTPRLTVPAIAGAAAGLAVALLIAGRIWPDPPPAARVQGPDAAAACTGPDGHLPALVAEVNRRLGAARPIRPVATHIAAAGAEWTATMRYRATVSADDPGTLATAIARLDPRLCTTMLVE